MSLESRTGGVIASYDPDTRLVRVSIPGITDGAEILPEAELEYPLGDDSRRTEIEINVGDEVWLAFQNGDPRYPIITGYRNPRVGNDVGTRRWFHKNFEILAVDDFTVRAKTINLFATTGLNMDVGTLTATAQTLIDMAAQLIKLAGSSSITLDTPVTTATGEFQDLAGAATLPSLSAVREHSRSHTHDVTSVQIGSSTRTTNPPNP